jgi:hypothetical protein
MEIEYQEIPIGSVMEYFVKGFEHNGGKQIRRHEAFVDLHKGIVVFKLYVEDAKPVTKDG